MYTTGQIAAKFGVSIKTIQRLDADGILVPRRNQFSNRRIYDHSDITKLAEILQSKTGRKNATDHIRNSDAYTPTDALIEAIICTCRAIRPELAQEFKDAMPSLGLDLSSVSDADMYIDNTFARSVFAKAFLTTEEIEYIKFKTGSLASKIKEATPIVEIAEPMPGLAETVSPEAKGVEAIIEIQADRKELNDFNMKNIDAIINSEIEGAQTTTSRFGRG